MNPAGWIQAYAPNPNSALWLGDNMPGWPTKQVALTGTTPQQKANACAAALTHDLAVLRALQCVWNVVWREATATPNYLVALILDGGYSTKDAEHFIAGLHEGAKGTLGYGQGSGNSANPSLPQLLSQLHPDCKQLTMVKQPPLPALAACLGMAWTDVTAGWACEPFQPPDESKPPHAVSPDWENETSDLLKPGAQLSSSKAAQLLLGGLVVRAWERSVWHKLLGAPVVGLTKQTKSTFLHDLPLTGTDETQVTALWAREFVLPNVAAGCLPLACAAWLIRRKAWWTSIPPQTVVALKPTHKSASLWGLDLPPLLYGTGQWLYGMPPAAVNGVSAAMALVFTAWLHYSAKGGPKGYPAVIGGWKPATPNSVLTEAAAPLKLSQNLQLQAAAKTLDKIALSVTGTVHPLESLDRFVYAATSTWARARRLLAGLIATQGLDALDATWALPLMASWDALRAASSKPTNPANLMVSAPTAPVWAADVLESNPPLGWTW